MTLRHQRGSRKPRTAPRRRPRLPILASLNQTANNLYMLRSRLALPLILSLCAAVFSACSGGNGAPDTGDGDGDNTGDGDGDSTGDGDGDSLQDPNPQSLADGLLAGVDLCEFQSFDSFLDYGEAAEYGGGFGSALSAVHHGATSVRGEFEDVTGAAGRLLLQWAGAVSTTAGPISGQVKARRADPLVCFTGQAERQVIDGQTYYVWAADMFALANEDGSCPADISTPGLSYGCLST